MRAAGPLVIVTLCLAIVELPAAGQGPAIAQTDQSAQVLSSARAALGGDGRIAAVKTFVATGRTRQVRGDNLLPIEFEVQCELPDKYARRDEFPAQDSGPSTTGFSGDLLIQIPRPPAPLARGGAPPPSPAQQEAALRGRLMAAKQDFARLLLGLFATSFSSFPLTFAYVAQAEAPQGKADVIDVRGPANFAARLFINSQTHLPIMLTWQAPAPPARAGGPAPPGPPQVTLVEQRLYFADYRDVDGLQLPFRLRRATGADTTEETTFDRFRINARLDPRRFDVGGR